MKNQWKPLRQYQLQAFTLLEMLLVILVISVLMLLFVPNLSKQKIGLPKQEMLLLSN